jgi:hypothetical protein
VRLQCCHEGANRQTRQGDSYGYHTHAIFLLRVVYDARTLAKGHVTVMMAAIKFLQDAR